MPSQINNSILFSFIFVCSPVITYRNVSFSNMTPVLLNEKWK